jgi:CRISPR-associated protein Csm3
MNDKITLISKYLVHFDLVCKTGLHLSGSDTGAGIGEMENPVIKDPVTGYPYVCGSSLKGRMRERLEWLLGNIDDQAQEIQHGAKPGENVREKILAIGQCKCGECEICHYFGHSENNADNEKIVLGPTRFIFRDAMPKQSGNYDQIKIWQERLSEGVYTEVKMENYISRLTAVATPRPFERVPAGSIFAGEIVIDLYQTPPGATRDDAAAAFKLLLQGMVAIEQSFLGGAGSRGSGKVEFTNLAIQKIPLSYFTSLEGEITKLPLNPNYTATQHWQNNSLRLIV